MAIRYLTGVNIDSNTLFVDSANNRVGIGTASPDFKLHLVGGSQYINGGQGGAVNSSPYTSANRLIFNNDYNDVARGPNKITLYDGTWLGGFGVHDNTLAYYSGGVHNWYQATTATNAVSLMTLTSTGSLGVGTTSPARKLTVQGADDGTMQLRLMGTASQTSYWDIGRESASTGQFRFIASRNGTVITPMVIDDQTGNVGIGTTSPAAKLHVSGENIIIDRASGDPFISFYTGGTTNNVSLYGGASTGFRAFVGGSERMRISSAGALKLNAYGSGSNTGTATYGLAVDSSGNVIEVTSTIDGSGTANYVTKWIDGNTIGNSQIFDNGTSVGINNASPSSSYVLDVHSRDNAYNTRIYQPSTSTGAYVSLLVSGAMTSAVGYFGAGGSATGNPSFRDNVVIGSQSAHPLVLNTSDAERMRITAAGNVGIGTTAPGAKLDIVSTGAGSEGLRVDGASGGFAFVVKGGSDYTSHIRAGATIGVNYFTTPPSNGLIVEGNVGIGTTSPGQKLEVNGNIKLSSTAGATATPSYIWLGNDYSNGATRDKLKIYLYNSGTEQYGFSIGSIGDVQYHSNAYHDFYVNNGNVVRITSAGNVGIGNTSPNGALSFADDVRTRKIVLWDGAANNDYQFYGFGVESSTMIQSIYDSTDRFLWVAGTGTTTRNQLMVLQGNGNVGIGNTTPGAVLTVGTQSSGTAGSGVAQDNSIVGRFGAANTAGRVTALTIANTATPTVGNNATLSFIVGGNYSATGLISSILQNTGTARTDMAFSVYNVNDNYERMRITGGGNVGIGTTSPASPLQISAASVLSQGVLSVVNTYASGGVYYPAARFVNQRGDHSYGIVSEFYTGATSGSDRPSILFNTGNSSNSWQVGMVTSGWGGNDSFGIGYRANNDPASFNAWPTARFLITTDGNVGIGTTSPGYKLDVNGTAMVRDNMHTTGALGIELTWSGNDINDSRIGRIRPISTPSQNPYAGGLAFDYYKYTGSTYEFVEGIRLAGSGNVGIGTNAPASILHVSTTGANAYSSTITKNSNMKGIVNTLSNNGDDMVGIYFATGTNAEGTHWSGITGSRSQSSTDWSTQLNFYTHDETVSNITDATQKMVIKGSGNVGIGTTSPTGKLEIAGATELLRLQTLYPTGSARGIISWYDTTNVTGRIYTIYDGTTVDMRIGALYSSGYNTSDLVTIKGNGNVGIGTTSPATKLHVFTTSNSDQELLRLTVAPANSSGAKPKAILGFYTPAEANTENYPSGRITSKFDVAGYANSRVTIESLDSVGNFLETLTAKNGNVGIGTTSPSYRLDVSGVTRFQDIVRFKANVWQISDNDAQNRLYFGGGGRTYFGSGDGYEWRSSGDTALAVLTNAGNLGIGTTAPDSLLHISGSGNTFARYTNTTSAGHYVDIGANSAGQSFVYGYGAYPLLFATNGSEAMRITSGGNVGVGITNPNSKMHVNGRLTIGGDTSAFVYGLLEYVDATTGFVISAPGRNMEIETGWNEKLTLKTGSTGLVVSTNNGAGTNTTRLSVTPSTAYFNVTGNVGIGTTSPSEKLHVDGNVIVTYNNSFQGINSIGNKAILARVSPTTGIINYAEYATAANLNGFVLGSDDARVKGNIATDSLEFITNGSTQAFINSSGNFGIGTTTPGYKLEVRGESYINNGANTGLHIDTTVADTTTRDAIYLFENDGQATGRQAISWYNGNQSYYKARLWTEVGSSYAATTFGIDVADDGRNVATRLAIRNGNVGIGTTSPSSLFHVAGDARITSGSLGVGVAPNATDGRIDASNDIVAYSTSDQRLKENVTPIENALEKVKTLTGVEFDWKEETAHVHGYHGHDVGIIAQDVQAVLPEAVRTNESGYLSVRYEKMIALLIEANKELAARVEELEKKLK